MDHVVALRPATKRSKDRRERILDAAQTMFESRGFSEASMTEVIRVAGGSKATLYKYFPNKEILYVTVVERATTQMLAYALADAPSPDEDDPESFLIMFGERVVRYLFKPEQQFISHALIAERDRFPGLNRAFFAAGPARTLAVLEERFAAWAERGLVRHTDARANALVFFNAFCNSLMILAHWAEEPVTDELISSQIRLAVDILLYGESTRAKKAAA
jgi:TetR/AcrR family transcriptional regulator, mexJK operon transcriptional repressor